MQSPGNSFYIVKFNSAEYLLTKMNVLLLLYRKGRIYSASS